jgi:hypothetical protein
MTPPSRAGAGRRPGGRILVRAHSAPARWLGVVVMCCVGVGLVVLAACYHQHADRQVSGRLLPIGRPWCSM